MGRYSYSNRETVDGLRTLSIYWLKKNNYLTPGSHIGHVYWSKSGLPMGNIKFAIKLTENDSYIILDYISTNRFSGEKFDVLYLVPVTRTRCYFGGHRYWFRCPGRDKNNTICGRRVAKLYGPETYFLCRHCYNLTYLSRNENRSYRNPIFRDFVIMANIEEREETLTKTTYKGIPTKKQMIINKLKSKMLNPNPDINSYLLKN